MNIEEDGVAPFNKSDHGVVRRPSQRRRRRVQDPSQWRKLEAVARQGQADEGVVSSIVVAHDGEEAQDAAPAVDGVLRDRGEVDVVAGEGRAAGVVFGGGGG